MKWVKWQTVHYISKRRMEAVGTVSMWHAVSLRAPTKTMCGQSLVPANGTKRIVGEHKLGKPSGDRCSTCDFAVRVYLRGTKP